MLICMKVISKNQAHASLSVGLKIKAGKYLFAIKIFTPVLAISYSHKNNQLYSEMYLNSTN